MKLKPLDKLPFTEHAQFVFKSILAGVLIALAGAIYLVFTNNPNIPVDHQFFANVAGAFLFSIGLIAVIALKANLYTGKIGYVDTKNKALRAFWMLLINLGIAFLIGLLFRGANVQEFAPMASRLAKPWYKMFFDGFGCGVLIYLAVELYNKTKSFLPVILCVMAFILSGAEHCIADAFYYGAGQLTWQGLGYLGLAVLGNTVGSIAIHWLQVGSEKAFEVPEDIQR